MNVEKYKKHAEFYLSIDKELLDTPVNEIEAKKLNQANFEALIHYSEYLADQLSKSIGYSEYLADIIDKKFTKFDELKKLLISLHPELKRRENFKDLFYGDDRRTATKIEEFHSSL